MMIIESWGIKYYGRDKMKRLFGESQRDIWERFASQIEGKYIHGGFLKSNRIEAKFDYWTMVFDTYSQSTGKSNSIYTRIRLAYKGKDDFNFQMYSKSFFSGFGKALGMKDIELGYGEFDDRFIIKGNDRKKLKELFASDRLRELLKTQKRINLEIRKDKRLFQQDIGDDIRQLYFYDMGLIKDEERLANLYFLMVHLINQLAQMEIAEREDLILS